MTPPAPPPRAPARAPQQAAAQSAASTARPQFGKRSPGTQGIRIIDNAVEGHGKTSMVAFAPNPAIIQVGGETGYDTLLAAGRVPSVDSVNVQTWSELLACVEDSASANYGVLAIDALGGAERLCHEFICQRDFRGDWGERGFASFQKGYDLSLTEWMGLLSRLDRVRMTGTHIVLLSHVKVATFKNPMGADFDRYVADCHPKTWGVSHKWADAVLFGTFISVIETDTRGNKAVSLKKGKAIGGIDRVFYTEHHEAYDAKNRYGMSSVIDVPADPAQVWSTIMAAMNRKEQ